MLVDFEGIAWIFEVEVLQARFVDADLLEKWLAVAHSVCLYDYESNLNLNLPFYFYLFAINGDFIGLACFE